MLSFSKATFFRRQRLLPKLLTRSMSSREQMHYDCVIVGGGPAGLSAAIRLKQLAQNGTDLSVCVLEKGSEIGAHVLSGNVFETRSLRELFPNFEELGAPLGSKAEQDTFLVLPNEKNSFAIPNFLLPPQLHNEGNHIISLSQLVRWLAAQAEELGVEIYSGFAADEILFSEAGSVRGVATKDVGIAKDGTHKDTFTPGIELIARQTLFAEGCRGSCTEELIKKFDLRAGKDEQTYGLGIKEVWQVPEGNIKKGFVQHTLGWPLQASPFSDVFGGTFLYHQEPNLVLVGMVVGLDYKNPYLSPYMEFQRWKHHPAVSKHLEGGECIAYGARVLNEGGYHSIPKLTFQGGALVGCSAGFLNAVKIKGSHTAMKSGMLAAEALYPALTDPANGETVATAGVCDDSAAPIEIPAYEDTLLNSWVGQELKVIRNTHSAFKWGTLAGMIHTALSCFITQGKEPWTLRNIVKDSDKTGLAKDHKPIEYPKPDGVISFDLLTNLQRSGTSHDDQPSHLKVKEELQHVPTEISITQYAAPESRFCPAGVYEYGEPDAEGRRHLIINSQNCVHCKCCSIKTPKEFIRWTVPEGGGGPAYTLM